MATDQSGWPCVGQAVDLDQQSHKACSLCIHTPRAGCNGYHKLSQIARFIGPTGGPPGSCWPQMGPMLAPWTLLSGMLMVWLCFTCISCSGSLYYQRPSRLLYWHLPIHQWLGSRTMLYRPSICLLYNVAFLKRVLLDLEQLRFHTIVVNRPPCTSHGTYSIY